MTPPREHREPTGVAVHDPATDTLRSDTRWTVYDHELGRWRVLVLRVARGKLEECADGEAP